ncbi:MAG: DegQ family serine endoprotease [Rhodobacteraceae bacterium]|nr:DegQ family serine endoprotease [Paracoccaceae bacterium]
MLMLLASLVMVLAMTQTLLAQNMPNSFADLSEEVSPAVVNITTSTILNRKADALNVPQGSPFDDLFREFTDRNRGDTPQPERRGTALGSGFLISADGYVVTNNHVIKDADEIEIELRSGKKLTAVVVGTDPRTDLALLKVEADLPLPFVKFGNSDEMRVGDWVLAIGNPLGQGFSVSAGIVSARGRTLSGSYDDFIQTDAAINRGNSGGPLFNMKGEVVGVNTAILSPSGGSIGIGFSMASNVVSGVIDQLEKFGETRRGWLGVSIQNVSADISDAIGMEEARGALVTDVPDGPAADAGIEAGDVILSFDGSDVSDTRELVRLVADAPVGETVRVVVYRDNGTQTILVTLGRLEDALAARAEDETPPEDTPKAEVQGMTLDQLTPQYRERFMIEDEGAGVVILEVAEGSPAAEKGLRPGDVIVEVSQNPVTVPGEVLERIAAAKDAGRRSVLLLVRSGGSGRFVALALEE